MSTFGTKLRKWTMRTFTVMGAITCGVFALVLVSLLFRCAGGDDVPRRTVLELRLDEPVSEIAPGGPFGEVLGRKTTTLHSLVESIDRAAGDERVVGLIAHVGAVEHGMARTQEIRDAILRFRKSGKFALAFAETFGELAPGNQGYYLATAFDEIWLQPTGGVGLSGLVSEAMFVKGALEKVGIEPQGGHRREYKNAFNMFTERRFTDAHKEAVKAVMDDHYAQLVAGIAEGRKLDESEVRSIVQRGPFLAPEAKEANLVDALGYRDEFLAHVQEKAGGEAELLFASKYLERAGKLYDKGTKIALIHGVGGVTRGESDFDLLSGDTSMGSATVSAAFRAAIEDENVKAIVFRVDSPGGSAVASDTIWRETVRAKEAGKPVIVSMGNVAGSGGYYVAAAATKIVAQPGTITGSIGVLGGKPVTREAWNKVGITWDRVATTEGAPFFSTLEPYDEAGWERLNAWLDRVYTDFKARVAEGRGLTEEQVEKIARGRIWSGARAKELGLVDELGGLETAIRLAKEAAGIGADERIELVTFPRSKSLLQQYVGDGPDSSEDYAAAQAEVATGLERLQPILRRLDQVGLTADDRGVLTMMPVEIGQ